MEVGYKGIMEETIKHYGDRNLSKERDFRTCPDHATRVCFTKELFFKYYKGGDVLDVGWYGYPMAYDFVKDDEYVAIDFLYHNKGKYPLVSPITCSFDDPPFRDKVFDFILWCEGPEHSLNPHRTLSILRALCRGRILITCPDGGVVNWEHRHVFNLEKLKELLASQFKVLALGLCPIHWLFGIGEI